MQNNNKENLPAMGRGDLFSDLFGRYARDFFSPYLDSEDRGFNPKVEVKETDQGYQVLAELPGLSEKDINLSLQDNSLIIEGTKEQSSSNESKGYYRSEFSYGSFYRSIPLRSDVDDKKIEATYEDGILKVSLVKRDDGVEKTRKIPINKKTTH